MTRCHHIKKVNTWGQDIKTTTLSSFASISTKVWRKADRFASKFQPFFPAWLFSIQRGGLLRSPSIQIPSCSAAHLTGSQELGTSPPKFSGYLATGPACWRKAWETLGASDSKYTNSERFEASRQFQSPRAPRQPFTQPTRLELGYHAGQHTGTPPAPLNRKLLRFLFHGGLWRAWV